MTQLEKFERWWAEYQRNNTANESVKDVAWAAWQAAQRYDAYSPKHYFWSKVTIGNKEQCWPFTGSKDRYGYGSFKVRGTVSRAHRLAFELANKRRLSEHDIVRHECDNRICCNPFHLHVGTHQDNTADRVARGRSASGEKNGRAKLTADEALQIYLSAQSVAEVADEHHISERVVRDIKAGVTWKSATYRPRKSK